MRASVRSLDKSAFCLCSSDKMAEFCRRQSCDLPTKGQQRGLVCGGSVVLSHCGNSSIVSASASRVREKWQTALRAAIYLGKCEMQVFCCVRITLPSLFISGATVSNSTWRPRLLKHAIPRPLPGVSHQPPLLHTCFVDCSFPEYYSRTLRTFDCCSFQSGIGQDGCTRACVPRISSSPRQMAPLVGFALHASAQPSADLKRDIYPRLVSDVSERENQGGGPGKGKCLRVPSVMSRCDGWRAAIFSTCISSVAAEG